MTDRQPIQTAPLDGTMVRLFHELDPQEGDFYPTTGRFREGRWIMKQWFINPCGHELLQSILIELSCRTPGF